MQVDTSHKIFGSRSKASATITSGALYEQVADNSINTAEPPAEKTPNQDLSDLTPRRWKLSRSGKRRASFIVTSQGIVFFNKNKT